MAERDWFGAKAETLETQKYVGPSRDDALKAADVAGVKAVRVIEGTQHLTADFRSDRLNILVTDGYVKKAAFFRGPHLPRTTGRSHMLSVVRSGQSSCIASKTDAPRLPICRRR
jgi:hypothetical protein